MSRRARAAGALVVALLLAGGLAGAAYLASSDDESGSGSGPVESRPVEPPEGSVAVGVPELPLSYDPFDVRSRTPAARQILGAVLPQLFDVTPEGEVEGRLVDDDSVEIEGSTVSFELVDGARWSDGTPITVRDIEFTFAVVKSDMWPGPDSGYTEISTIRGEGREVNIDFRGRVPPGWKRLFSGDDYVLPQHRLDPADWTRVWDAGPDIAGGPYVLDGFTPGLDVVLTANPEWWGEGPGVEAIRVLTVTDSTTLERLFEQGELDVVWVPTYTERRRVVAEEVDGDFEVSESEPGGHLVELVVNTDTVDEPVRVGALDLVDRDRFVSVLLAGEADVATSWGRLDRDEGWPQWFLNARTAEAAGSDTLLFAGAEEEPMGSLLVRSVQRRSKAFDLRFDSVRVGSEVLDGEWLPAGDFDVALVDEIQWPDPCWSCRFGSGQAGESNWARVDDFDELAARADTGDDEAAARLERRLEREGVILPLWRPRAVVASRGVDGVEANAWWPGPLYRAERWR